jgi:hypothetical protein
MYNFVVGKPKVKRLWRTRHRWEDNNVHIELHENHVTSSFYIFVDV